MVTLTRVLFGLALFIHLLVPAGAQAPATTVKLATLAPQGSVWHNELAQMDADWRKASGGRVAVRIFPAGVQGDEDAIIRRLRINALQAASLSVLGLAHIDEAFNVFAIPLFYESVDELYHVMQKLTPDMEKRLDAKGFVLLSWGYAGWVQVFSRQPVRSLDDLKRAKIYTTAGDASMIQWYQSNGFNPVAVASTDMLTSLQTGSIDAVPLTPLAVLTLQLYSRAPHMLDLGLAPLAGAQIMSKQAWNALPEDARPALLAASRAAGKRMLDRVPEADRRAIAEMEKKGLTVSRIKGTPQAAPFEGVAVKYANAMRGQWVPPDVFDRAVKERDAYRAQKGTAR